MNRLDDFKLQGFFGGETYVDPVVAETPFSVLLGVELELENAVIEKQIPQAWSTHEDNSLRNGIEFVLRKPLADVKLVDAIKRFYAKGYTYTSGPRTSTHIHVNMSEQTVGVLRSMFAISYMLEDGLFRAIGAKRKYCGYCMQLSEMSPDRLTYILTTTNSQRFNMSIGGNNEEKYYGFNVNSVRKHGTVELRYFPGGPTEEELLDWCLYATMLKAAGMATTIDNLKDMQDAASLGVWLNAMFGKWATKIIGIVGVDDLYGRLLEVLAMVPDEEDVARQDKLVFSTTRLSDAVCSFYKLEGAQREYLVAKSSKLGAMSQNDWYQILNAARMLPAKSGSPSVTVTSSGGLFDGLNVIQARMPPAPRANRAQRREMRWEADDVEVDHAALPQPALRPLGDRLADLYGEDPRVGIAHPVHQPLDYAALRRAAAEMQEQQAQQQAQQRAQQALNRQRAELGLPEVDYAAILRARQR